MSTEPAADVSNQQSGQTTSPTNIENVNQGPKLNTPVAEKKPLSPKAQQILEQNEAARKDAEKESQFFKLNIGEETIITVNPEKTANFKTKTQDGRLVTQFRYFFYDMLSDRDKQWDVFHNISDDIDQRIKQGIFTMKVKCLANTKGNPKYEIHDLNA